MSGCSFSLSFYSLPHSIHCTPLALFPFFLLALCWGSALTQGALMKSFQGRMGQSEMSFFDQMSLKQGLSYHLIRSTSLALCLVSLQLSQTQSLNEITCGFLVFLPLILYKENYCVHWKESSAVLQVDMGISFTLIVFQAPLILEEFTKDHICLPRSKLALTGQRFCWLWSITQQEQ